MELRRGNRFDRKYFNKSSNTLKSRVTNELISSFKIKYKQYYGEKCSSKDDRLHYEIRRSFEVLELDIYNPHDREWYEENVLHELFERYDDLGYASQKFPRYKEEKC